MAKTLSLIIKNKTPELVNEDSFIVVNKFNLEGLEDFRKSFYKLLANPDIDVIPLMINSYGGSVDALLAMVDIIQASAKTVATIANGPAMSCGAILLAAGSKGFRFSSPNARIMIHQVSGAAIGKASDLESDVKDFKEVEKISMGLLDKLCGKPSGFFMKLIEKNKYSDVNLTAKKAKQLGLVDHVGVPTLLEYK